MKKTAKTKSVVGVLCTVFTFSTFLASCSKKIGGYTHPVFQTEYTQEEHIQRINQQTEAIFAEEINSGKLLKYNVEILYAYYDNDPEYFLVELEYVDECIEVICENPDYLSGTENQEPKYIYHTTKYQHFIGFIEDDVYKTGIPYYDSGSRNPKDCFMPGRSAYALYTDGKGVQYGKKYYGGRVQGIERNGEIIIVAGMNCYDNGIEWHQHKTYKSYPECNIGDVVSPNLYSSYMVGNYKLFVGLYRPKVEEK